MNQDLPDNRSENSEFADAVDHPDLLSRPDHVVGGDRRLDHLHQDVSVSLFRVLDALKEGSKLNQLVIKSSFVTYLAETSLYHYFL